MIPVVLFNGKIESVLDFMTHRIALVDFGVNNFKCSTLLITRFWNSSNLWYHWKQPYKWDRSIYHTLTDIQSLEEPQSPRVTIITINCRIGLYFQYHCQVSSTSNKLPSFINIQQIRSGILYHMIRDTEMQLNLACSLSL